MNTKANRNKLTYSGITIYGLLLLLCVFSVAMALLPDIPCNAYILNSKFMYGAGDTLNQQLSVVFAEALLYSSVVFYLINTLKIKIENTDAKRFVFAIYCFIIAVGSFLATERIWVAIAAILEAMPKA